MYQIMTGAIVMACCVIALFFLRFWRSSGDRFFLYFALAFVLEGAHRCLVGLEAVDGRDPPLYYLLRLLAYSLILWAIIAKNWPRTPSGK